MRKLGPGFVHSEALFRENFWGPIRNPNKAVNEEASRATRRTAFIRWVPDKLREFRLATPFIYVDNGILLL